MIFAGLRAFCFFLLKRSSGSTPLFGCRTLRDELGIGLGGKNERVVV